MKHLLSALGAAVLLATVPGVSLAENMNLMLNWTPTADHSPIYFAKSKGWYSEAGIDLAIEAGKGSAARPSGSAPAAPTSAFPTCPPRCRPGARAPTSPR